MLRKSILVISVATVIPFSAFAADACFDLFDQTNSPSATEMPKTNWQFPGAAKSPSKPKDNYETAFEFQVSGGNGLQNKLQELMNQVADANQVKLITATQPRDVFNHIFQDGATVFRLEGSSDNIKNFLMDMKRVENIQVSQSFQMILLSFNNAVASGAIQSVKAPEKLIRFQLTGGNGLRKDVEGLMSQMAKVYGVRILKGQAAGDVTNFIFQDGTSSFRIEGNHENIIQFLTAMRKTNSPQVNQQFSNLMNQYLRQSP